MVTLKTIKHPTFGCVHTALIDEDRCVLLKDVLRVAGLGTYTAFANSLLQTRNVKLLLDSTPDDGLYLTMQGAYDFLQHTKLNAKDVYRFMRWIDSSFEAKNEKKESSISQVLSHFFKVADDFVSALESLKKHERKTYTTTEIARPLNMSANTMNRSLANLGILLRDPDGYFLKEPYQSYGQIENVKIVTQKGTKVKRHMVWTEEGKHFVESILKNKNGRSSD